MACAVLVDKEDFFNNMISEIMKNDDIDSNHYYLCRKGNTIDFYGNMYGIFEYTEVIDDSQLKDYYDLLSTTFSENFQEFIIYDDPRAELLVLINGKAIHINSDNMCDDWLSEKKYGKRLKFTII